MDWTQHPVDYDASKLLDREYCTTWYSEHPQFWDYEFYCSFYEPLSILLFESSKKPLISLIPIRAFYPHEGRI
jgi:hypothetical protein